MKARTLATVTIGTGTQDSAEQVNPAFGLLDEVDPGNALSLAVEIHSPAGLAEEATIMAAAVAAGTRGAVQSGGVDVTMDASKMVMLHPAPDYLTIHLAAVAAAPRIFQVVWRLGR